jgi:hypothetical protein
VRALNYKLLKKVGVVFITVAYTILIILAILQLFVFKRRDSLSISVIMTIDYSLLFVFEIVVILLLGCTQHMLVKTAKMTNGQLPINRVNKGVIALNLVSQGVLGFTWLM